MQLYDEKKSDESEMDFLDEADMGSDFKEEDVYAEMAPIKPFSKESQDIVFGRIDLGIINFHLKCINGIYRDNSLRLHHTIIGHIIGSGNNENPIVQQQQPPSEVV